MSQPGMCGRTVDRYELLEWIGGGGFGAVYKARHKVVHRVVALKLLRPSVHQPPDVIERFVTEARAAASIGNPHIVDVFDAGHTPDGTHFLAMELVEGSSLGEVLRVEERLSVERAGAILLQVLDALAAAHAAGIVHRDIKPGNIMLVGTEPGGARRDFVKLVDFGISKAAYLADTPTTKSGMSMGTPGYAAPEQYIAARSVDQRADVYSAIVVLYKMLAGCLPFEAESYEEMVVRVCTQPPAPLRTHRPDLSSALSAVVDRGLSTKPEQRFESVVALRAALEAALEGRGEPDTMPSGPARLPSGDQPLGGEPVSWDDAVVQAAGPRPASRSRSIWIALGVVLVAGLGAAGAVGAWALIRGAPAPETSAAPTQASEPPREELGGAQRVDPAPDDAVPAPAPIVVATPVPVDAEQDEAEEEGSVAQPEPSRRHHARRRPPRHRPTPTQVAPTQAAPADPAPAPSQAAPDPFRRDDLVPFDPP